MYIFLKSILTILILTVTICILCYIGTPVYRFQQGMAFNGSSIYNPYSGIDSTQWLKGNFHAHQKEKPACDYTAEEFIAAYQATGYDIIQLADHQHINKDVPDLPGYIPTYEHGFSLNKYHQLMIGAKKVTFRDLPVITTQSQMQYLIRHLEGDSDLMAVNHPGQLRIVGMDVYKNLRGYDLLELNPGYPEGRMPNKYWDMALSEGIYSNMIANDDAHSITNRGSLFQRSFTMLNTPSLDQKDIVSALKDGRAYGVWMPVELNKQQNPHSNLHKITNIGLRTDTIFISLSNEASEIKFIGQGGKVMSKILGTKDAEYKFATTDSYIRAEVTMPNGLQFFSNPFVRSDLGQPQNPITAEVLLIPTILMNVLYIILSIILTLTIGYIWGLQRKYFHGTTKKCHTSTH